MVEGLLPLGEYLINFQNRVVEYMATHPLPGLCLKLMRLEGVPESLRSWEQRGGDQANGGRVTGREFSTIKEKNLE